MQYGGAYGSIRTDQPYRGGGGPVLYGSILPPKSTKRRLNVLAIAVNVFLPWALFCLVMAMLSFEMHYKKPSLCQTLLIIAGIFLGLVAALDVLYVLVKRSWGQATGGNPSWVLFLCVSCGIAIVIGAVVGNRNFWLNTERFYDITSLNAYEGVDPSRMRGQEIMDAGRVGFVRGVHLDLNKSMGFKNMEMYCVAPITGGRVEGDPPFASYDFWAVGKDCCSDSSAADFHCGAWDNPHARGGVRVMRDEERAFYRLAVQQAQSAYAIKAIHPLFFHWVADPTEETYSFQQEAFKAYLVGMFAFFVFQTLQVYAAAQIFFRCLDYATYDPC